VELRLLMRDGNDATAGGAGAERRAAGPRPTLTVIQGGAPRRPRTGRSTTSRLAVAPPAAPDPRLDEVAVYLRPIPSWVPRLW